MKHYLIAASILVVAVTQIPDFIAKNYFNRCVEHTIKIYGGGPPSDNLASAVGYCNSADLYGP